MSFILSDIIGDPLELISSGPTIISSNSVRNSALDILEKYNVQPEDCVKEVLNNPHSENESVNDCSNNVVNVLIGSNKVALETCLDNANSEGSVMTVIEFNSVAGEMQ